MSVKRVLPLVVDDNVVGYVSVNTNETFGIKFYEDTGSREVKEMLVSGEANFFEIKYMVAGNAELGEYQAQMREKGSLD